MSKKHRSEEDEKSMEDEDKARMDDEGSAQQRADKLRPAEEPEDFPTVLPNEEMDHLRSELDQALSKGTEYLEGWQRERAEFFNYKKRVEREQQQSKQNAVGNALRRYLDIADDLSRALKNNNRPTEGDGAIWAAGIDLIYRKMLAAFEADGVKIMETDGKYFDPNLHEAISHEDSPDHESGEIIEVVQPGYTMGDKVLRPARVRVAR